MIKLGCQTLIKSLFIQIIRPFFPMFLIAEMGSDMIVTEADLEDTLGDETDTAETENVEPVFGSLEDRDRFNERY